MVSQFNNPNFSEVFYNPFNSFLTLLFVEERLLAYHENVGSNLARQFNETKQTLRSNLLKCLPCNTTIYEWMVCSLNPSKKHKNMKSMDNS